MGDSLATTATSVATMAAVATTTTVTPAAKATFAPMTTAVAAATGTGAAVTTVASMSSLNFLLTAHQGDTDDREEHRDAKNHKTIHS